MRLGMVANDVLLAVAGLVIACGSARTPATGAVAPPHRSSAANAAGSVDTYALGKLHFERARKCFAQADCRCAIGALRTSLEYRASPIAQHNLGVAYESCGEIEEAIHSYERYLESDPADCVAIETHVRELKVLTKSGCSKEDKLSGVCKRPK